jgi:hypothetical protein
VRDTAPTQKSFPLSRQVLIMPSAERELERAYQWIYERAPEAAVAWYNEASLHRKDLHRSLSNSERINFRRFVT